MTPYTGVVNGPMSALVKTSVNRVRFERT